MKCPYCNEDLKEWDGRFYCANAMCPAKQEDLPKFIWQALIDGKKAQDALNYAIGVLDNLTEIGGVDMEIIKIKKMAGIK